MTESKLFHLAQYGAYRAVAGLITRLPQGALRAWGRFVGRVGYPLLARARRTTLHNLEMVFPELDSAARERLARGSFEWQGWIFHELVWASARPQEIIERFEVVGIEHLDRARALGKGLFILTAHFGCWELGRYPAAKHLGELHLVARPQNNPYFAAEFERLRERDGVVQIDRGRAGVRILRVLKRGGAVAMAIDQRVRPAHAMLVPFLGRYAWTSRLPAHLSTLTGCPTVPAICLPLDHGRYRITFHPGILPEGEGDDEVERLTRRFNDAIEPHIRAHPDLWLWSHRRWQRTNRVTRPEARERLSVEASLPPARPLGEVGRQGNDAATTALRLERLVGEAFLEDCRHLVLTPAEAGSGAGREGGADTTLPPIAVAAALGVAFARQGYATRYLDRSFLGGVLAPARDQGRLASALRDLDPFALVVIAGGDPRRLDRGELDLLARLLEHRHQRGSVVLAAAGAGALAAVAAEDERLRSFFGRAETLEIPAATAAAFEVDPLEPASEGAAARTTARAGAH